MIGHYTIWACSCTGTLFMLLVAGNKPIRFLIRGRMKEE